MGRGPFGPGRGPGFGPRQGWGRGWRGPRGPFGGHGGPWGVPDDMLALRAQAAEVARLFAIASRGAFEDKERVGQLRSFLERAHKELAEMIYSSPQAQQSEQGEAGSGPADIGQA